MVSKHLVVPDEAAGGQDDAPVRLDDEPIAEPRGHCADHTPVVDDQPLDPGEFGGEIPVGPFALIGGDEIGRGVVATLTGHRSPAVLMRSHGVFTIGSTGRDAVKAAVMCEDVARTIHLARAFGELAPLPSEAVDALHARYKNYYGQR